MKLILKESSPQEKLSGVILDDQPKVRSFMSDLCKKASQRWAIMKAYINSQFDYFLLVWMTSDMFKLSKSTYNLRNKKDFVSNHMKTVYFGTESLSFLDPKLCDLSFQVSKILPSQTHFKSQV